MKGKINNDVHIGIILTFFSGFFFYQATEMPEGTAQFPKLILGLFVLLSILLIAMGIRKTIKPDTLKPGSISLPFNVIKSPLAVFVIVVIYIVLINVIGFFAATTIYTPVMMLYYKVKSWKPIIVTTVSLNLFVYLLFVFQLKVQLP